MIPKLHTTYVFQNHLYCHVHNNIYLLEYIRYVYTDKVVFQFDLASIHELGPEMASIHELELGPIDVDPPT